MKERKKDKREGVGWEGKGREGKERAGHKVGRFSRGLLGG